MGEKCSTEYLPSFLNDQNQLDDLELEDADNGLCFSNIYIPEEVLLHILSYIDPKDVLNYSLVCQKWNNVIKSYALWATVYKRKYNRKPKKLPWYLYYCLLSTNFFDTNLLRNGNGEEKFNNWKIKENGGNEWKVEDPPVGADPLPIEVPEFNNKTSCFATSYETCNKMQEIKLGQSKLFRYVLDSYKPHIYLSEWTAGRFDCGCVYRLGCGFIGKKFSPKLSTQPWVERQVTQWEGRQWEKIEMRIEEYPEGVEGLIFEHEGSDSQYWAGHYGSKMAGGIIKLLFDSIEPLPTDEHGNQISKKYSKFHLISNASVIDDRGITQMPEALDLNEDPDLDDLF